MTPSSDANELRPERSEAGVERVLATFEIRHRQCLDASGALVGEPPAFARDSETMIALYRAMTLTRIFDAKAIALQRTGQLGTYPSCAGQEAVGIGYASAMTAEDVMFITYREQAAQIWRGVTLTELLQFWGGDERGCDYSGPREDFPPAVPIASQATHAAGVATAFKLRNESRVAVCALGDGATSKGDFYEAVNLAGVWRLPVVFVVINNYWAISMPREKQTATETLAQKAIAGGIPGNSGRRQRHHCRARDDGRGHGARPQRRRRERHRSHHLSHGRPHHRRRCLALPPRGIGERGLEARSFSAPPHLSRQPALVDQGRRGTAHR